MFAEVKRKKEEEKKKEVSLSNRQRVELFKKVIPICFSQNLQRPAVGLLNRNQNILISRE